MVTGFLLEHLHGAHRKIEAAAHHHRKASLHAMRREQVIRIEEDHIASLRFLDAEVAAMVGPHVLVERDELDARIHSGEPAKQLLTPIRGGIIHQDQLPMFVRLSDDALHHLANEAAFVEAGNNDGYQGIHGSRRREGRRCRHPRFRLQATQQGPVAMVVGLLGEAIRSELHRTFALFRIRLGHLETVAGHEHLSQVERTHHRAEITHFRGDHHRKTGAEILGELRW